MTPPLPWNSGMLAWHIYRLPVTRIQIGKYPKVGQVITDYPGVEDWIKENIRGPWSRGSCNAMNTRPFFFKEKQDALLFKLTWYDKVEKPKFNR